MSIFECLLSISLVCLWIMELMLDRKQGKLIDECLKTEEELIKSLSEKTDMEIELKRIVINAKKTRENLCVTFEKIERELFK